MLEFRSAGWRQSRIANVSILYIEDFILLFAKHRDKITVFFQNCICFLKMETYIKINGCIYFRRADT